MIIICCFVKLVGIMTVFCERRKGYGRFLIKDEYFFEYLKNVLILK